MEMSNKLKENNNKDGSKQNISTFEFPHKLQEIWKYEQVLDWKSKEKMDSSRKQSNKDETSTH